MNSSGFLWICLYIQNINIFGSMDCNMRDDITPLSKLGEMGNGYPVQNSGWGFSQGAPPSIGQMGQMTHSPMMTPGNATQYQTLNVHQNPYGHPPPNGGNTLPTISVEELRSSRSGPQSGFPANFNPGPGHGPGHGPMFDPTYDSSQPSVPCRGVEMDPTRFSNDPETLPNHIPPPPVKLTTDYLKDFELETAKLATDYQKNKYRKEHLENIWDEMQIPILLAVLFFLFQLPYWNILIFRYMKIFGLFGEDGNMNLYGIFFKSVLFGICCYGVTLL